MVTVHHGEHRDCGDESESEFERDQNKIDFLRVIGGERLQSLFTTPLDTVNDIYGI